MAVAEENRPQAGSYRGRGGGNSERERRGQNELARVDNAKGPGATIGVDRHSLEAAALENIADVEIREVVNANLANVQGDLDNISLEWRARGRRGSLADAIIRAQR